MFGVVDKFETVQPDTVAYIDTEDFKEVEAYASKDMVEVLLEAEVVVVEGEVEHGAAVDASGEDGDGLPAVSDVEGDVEEIGFAVGEGVVGLVEEAVFQRGGFPVGGEAVEGFGLEIEAAVDGDAVGEAEGPVAEDTHAVAVVGIVFE